MRERLSITGLKITLRILSLKYPWLVALIFWELRDRGKKTQLMKYVIPFTLPFRFGIWLGRPTEKNEVHYRKRIYPIKIEFVPTLTISKGNKRKR